MPGGFGQFGGSEFLQGPMANVAVGYGAQMANQGKEYVEKHVCAVCVVPFSVLCIRFRSVLKEPPFVQKIYIKLLEVQSKIIILS